MEERRNLEQMTLQMGFELEQQRQEPLATGVMCWEQVQVAPSARRIVGSGAPSLGPSGAELRSKVKRAGSWLVSSVDSHTSRFAH